MAKLSDVYIKPGTTRTSVIFASRLITHGNNSLQDELDNNTLEGVVTINPVINASTTTGTTGTITTTKSGGTHTINLVVPETALIRKVDAPAITGTTSWVFEADSNGPVLRTTTFSPVLDTKSMVITGDTSGTEAGTRTITVHPRRGFKWTDNTTTTKTFTWSITKKTLSSNPTMTYPDTRDIGGDSHAYFQTESDFAMTFTGSTNNVEASYETDYVDFSGSTQYYGASTTTNTFSLKYPNSTTWTNGTTANKTITATMNKRSLSIPSFSSATGTVSWNTSTVAANTQTVNAFFSTYFVNGSTDLTVQNAGTYSQAYSLIYPENTTWSDGTTVNKTISYVLNPKTLTATEGRFAQNNSLIYNQNTQGASFNNYSYYVRVTGTTTGLNAGTYYATASLVDTQNLRWSDGTTADKNAVWDINKLTLSVPNKTNTLTYSGSVQYPSWNSNYDTTYMTVSGTTSGTNAGTYTAYFNLRYPINTQWTNGTTNQVAVNWAMNRQSVPRPSQSNTLTYSGSAQNVAWNSNYSSTYMTMSGTTRATSAGTYTAYFTPTGNYSFNGTTTQVSVNWYIGRATIPSSYSTNFVVGRTYNGSAQTGVKNYNSTYHTLSGTTRTTSAGTYSFTITPTSNYKWYQGGSNSRTYSWVINRAQATLSSGREYLQVLTDGARNRTYIDTNCGIISCRSNNTNICTVSYSGGKLEITGKGTAGTTSITVSAYDDNHTTSTMTIRAKNILGQYHGEYDVCYWKPNQNTGFIDMHNATGESCAYIYNNKSQRFLILKTDAGNTIPGRLSNIIGGDVNPNLFLPTEDGASTSSTLRIRFGIHLKVRCSGHNDTFHTGVWKPDNNFYLNGVNVPCYINFGTNEGSNTTKTANGEGEFRTDNYIRSDGTMYMNLIEFKYGVAAVPEWATSWFSIKYMVDVNSGLTVFSATGWDYTTREFGCNDDSECNNCNNCNNCSDCDCNCNCNCNCDCNCENCNNCNNCNNENCDTEADADCDSGCNCDCDCDCDCNCDCDCDCDSE